MTRILSKTTATFAVGLLALGTSVFGEKLQSLGLDEAGRPVFGPEQRGDSARAQLVFPSASGPVRVPEPALDALRGASKEDRLEALLQFLADGPTPTHRSIYGAEPLFPRGTGIRSVQIDDSGVAVIDLDLPADYLRQLGSGQENIERLVRDLDFNLFDAGLNGFSLRARDPESGEYLPVGFFEEPVELEFPELFIPDTAVAPKQPEDAPVLKQYSTVAAGRPTGALTNRVVHMNAGHGRTYRSAGNWGLQRSFVWNNIEDFSNADLVHQYVYQYLHNAGADVFTVREFDPNPNMVIVDNDDTQPADVNQRSYVETGTWGTSSLAGFATRASYLRSDTTSQSVNPFSLGTNRLVQCVVGAPTATATWTPTIPAAGYYNVYVSHSAFTNRSPQAHYRIYHAGGETDYYLDQRRYRFTWVFIGRYYFEAGRNPNTGRVVLTNSSTSSDHFVAADAVRFGGGMGLINRNNNGTSGFRRYDEEAVYHLQFSGAPTSVHQVNSTNDESAGWSGRPRFADWLRTAGTAYGAPAQEHVAIANHTNATAAGTARGIISYLYSGREGQIHDRFRQAVHNQIVHNLQTGYGGDFVVNSNPLRSGQYGEANPNNTGGIPIFLGEWLFHDNERDMALYHDPKFRRILARGIYQGIVKFFQSEYGGPGTLLPEPPRNLRVRAISPTSVQLDWQAPPVGPANGFGDAATGYRVHRSTHGRGFPPGTAVTANTTTITGLQPGTTYYFYVTATNAGGVSFPTETLAVRTPINGSTPRLLIVNGFDKTDIATRVQTPFSGSILYRQIVEEMNGYDYIVEHARAIDATGRVVSFDSAEHDAVEANLIQLTDYETVIWIGGIQAEVSTTDPTDDTALKANTRARIATFLNGGGRLFMTGASIAWDLNRLNQGTWSRNNLRMTFSQEGSNLSAATPASASIFSGLPTVSFGTGESPYRVHWPDIVNPQEGAISALRYGTAAGTNVVDGFEAIGGWRQPSFSAQTNADASSSFQIATSPVRSGSGSGRLNYVWGSGDFIRLYNSSLPEFPAASDFSIWVNGDGSGHRLRICLRDAANVLFVNEWLTLDFTGWRQIVWEDVINNPKTSWPTAGTTTLTGPNVRFDSIQVQKVTAGNSGSIHFDDAISVSQTSQPSTGPSAAIQYSGDFRVVYFGFPFETIVGAENRAAVMGRVLDFLLDSDSTPRATLQQLIDSVVERENPAPGIEYDLNSDGALDAADIIEAIRSQ